MMVFSFMKGLDMFKTAIVLTCVCLAGAAWAQAPAKNAQPSSNKVRTTSSGASAPFSTEVTARLQAQANAQALASAQAKPNAAPFQAAPTLMAAAPLSPSVTAHSVAAQTAVTASPAKTVRNTSVEQPMGAEELAIADRVHKGQLSCELGAIVRVDADPSQPGYFNLHGKGFRYRMHPVATSTGAIRLEDKKAGTVWLQLANKSMLMDQNKGRRIADECAHAEQVVFAQDMKNNPPPKLFDTSGMGR
jgi:hypothetical protein